MATVVDQKYTPSLNISVTRREGKVSRISTWTTGVSGSTDTIVSEV